MKCKVLSKSIIFGLAALISLTFIGNTDNLSVHADDKLSTERETVKTELTEEKKADITFTSQELFASKAVNTCEYLYNLDGSPDYIYTEFKGGGYAIYAQKTLELMEYSLSGDTPINDFSVKNYYAGPANYFQRESDTYYNIVTREKLKVSPAEAIEFAKQMRESLVESKIEEYELTAYDFDASKSAVARPQSTKNSVPEIDSNNLIKLQYGGNRILYDYYFTVNPTHGNNNAGETYENGASGTCGAVAAQILLGYNNYYINRKIIPDRFLNGYSDTEDKVTNYEYNPNYCKDPTKMTRQTIGTRSEGTGANSFYAEMIRQIGQSDDLGAITTEVSAGITLYLSKRLSKSEYEINWKMLPINLVPKISSEIDANRPLIISTLKLLGGQNHYVVGYGYQNYTYPNGEGTYLGYIVHYGWQNYNNVWINSSWCNGYISLKINHTHNHDTYVGEIEANTGRNEYKCSECGHRTDAVLNMLTVDRYKEEIINLPQNNYPYKDYYITFENGGNKLFQTFGSKDTIMSLYDNSYNRLAYDDDSGYVRNSLFSYTVKQKTPYILRVQFYNPTSSPGKIKIGITPSDTVYNTYDEILHDNGIESLFSWSVTFYTTKVVCFTPKETHTYQIYTKCSNRLDMYLYAIDPTSVEKYLYDDDSAGSFQPMIEMELKANIRYFFICSPFNICYGSGEIQLFFHKMT